MITPSHDRPDARPSDPLLDSRGIRFGLTAAFFLLITVDLRVLGSIVEGNLVGEVVMLLIAAGLCIGLLTVLFHETGFGANIAFLFTGGIFAVGGVMAAVTETQHPNALTGGAILAAVGVLLALYGGRTMWRHSDRDRTSA